MQYFEVWPQIWQNDLSSFPRQAIQHHSNPSLCPYHWYQRSWIWSVLWRPRHPLRTNTKKRCPFHHWGLECKSRQSRDTWSNKQVWPWRTKWRRAKANWILQKNALGIANALFQQHKRWLYTWRSSNGQYQNHVDCIPL